MESFDTKIQDRIKETLINYKKLIKLSLKNSIFFPVLWKTFPPAEISRFPRYSPTGFCHIAQKLAHIFFFFTSCKMQIAILLWHQ